MAFAPVTGRLGARATLLLGVGVLAGLSAWVGTWLLTARRRKAPCLSRNTLYLLRETARTHHVVRRLLHKGYALELYMSPTMTLTIGMAPDDSTHDGNAPAPGLVYRILARKTMCQQPPLANLAALHWSQVLVLIDLASVIGLRPGTRPLAADAHLFTFMYPGVRWGTVDEHIIRTTSMTTKRTATGGLLITSIAGVSMEPPIDVLALRGLDGDHERLVFEALLLGGLSPVPSRSSSTDSQLSLCDLHVEQLAADDSSSGASS